MDLLGTDDVNEIKDRLDRLINEAMCAAARKGLTDIIVLLLSRGADIHSHDDEALISACDENHIEVVQLLLDCGANIHARSDSDNALFLAVYNNNLEMVKLLLSRGAIVSHEEMRFALSKNYIDIAETLVNAAPLNVDANALDTIFEACVEYFYINGARTMLLLGANINGDLALSRSLKAGKTEMVRLLLENGVSVKPLFTLQYYQIHNDARDIVEEYKLKTCSHCMQLLPLK